MHTPLNNNMFSGAFASSARNKKQDDYFIVPIGATSSSVASVNTKRKTVPYKHASDARLQNTFLLFTGPDVGVGTSPSPDDTQPAGQQQLNTNGAERPVVRPPAANTAPSKNGWGWLGTKTLYTINSVAVVMHASLFIIMIIMGTPKTPKIWHLKHDRIHAAPAPNNSVAATPFVQVTLFGMANT